MYGCIAALVATHMDGGHNLDIKIHADDNNWNSYPVHQTTFRGSWTATFSSVQSVYTISIRFAIDISGMVVQATNNSIGKSRPFEGTYANLV